MEKAFAIVTTSRNRFHVEGLQAHRPIGAFSFLGRYRVIDFQVSNLSNSGVDRIQVYVRTHPRSLAEHLGTGRHYNINSKRGKLQLLFASSNIHNDIYNTDIQGFLENLPIIQRSPQPYVIIAPSYYIFAQNYKELLEKHIESGADITLLYQKVTSAKEAYHHCDILNLNRQRGVKSIAPNNGESDDRNVFMDTFIMKKDLLIELVKKAKALSSVYNLTNIINLESDDLDIRAVQHKGYFAAITDFKSYYDANLSLLNPETAKTLFDPSWPVYTFTTDSAPTHYFAGASIRNSMVANGCLIEGTVENCVIGRNCVIKKGAVVRNSVILSHSVISENVLVENQVVDKWARIIHAKEVVATPENPGYVMRDDTL